MTIYIAIIVVLIICIIFIYRVRKNKINLKLKTDYGKKIDGNIISWKAIPGRPTRYAIKVEYEINEKKENKTFITSGKFAKKYEHDRNIQIVVVPNSSKVFLEEENWKVQNIWNIVFLLVTVVFLLQLLLVGFVYGGKDKIEIANLYTLMQEKDEIYELTVKNKQGKVIFQEQYIGEPRVEAIYDDTLLIVRGRGDWHVYTFINIETELISEGFSDISAWNHEKVVYATFEDGETKIIIQDIYDKDTYYMEILRDFSPEAIPYRLILKAEFLNDLQLKLKYYSGENWEEVSEVINLSIK